MGELKPTTGLIKRYAEFTLAHTPDRVLPPEFVPFLKPETQDNYFKKNEKSFLNFDFIQKYFGDEKAKEYVETQAKKLDFIPKQAHKYIPEEYKNIYEIFDKYQINWTDETQDSEESIAATPSEVNPVRITYSQYIKIPKGERDILTKLGKTKQPELSADNNNIIYSVPTIFFDKNQNYYLLPTKVNSNIYELEGEWIIIDDSDQIIKKINNINEISIDNQDIFASEISSDNNIIRYHPLNKVKINGKPLKPIEEAQNIWAQYSLQRRAGIIK